MRIYNGRDKQGVEVKIYGSEYLLEDGVWYIRIQNLVGWYAMNTDDEKLLQAMLQIEKHLYFVDDPIIPYEHGTW